MIDYPNELNIIFEKLKKFHIKPIIVGGYIRDKLLNIDSKDIDIELYGVSSFKIIENILKEFGSVNSVGKSFGVCKIKYKDLDLDFSLPRTDSKVASGHKGFCVNIYKDLDYKSAASRRDFTINSIGYDIFNQQLLDPFNGQVDIKNKILQAVDINKFNEDPLRILRAIAFSARFNFTLDKELFLLCKKMIQANLLDELAQERIFLEIEKLLLKSRHPSIGLQLLKDLDAFVYFKEFSTLSQSEFEEILLALDTANKDIIIILAILAHKFSNDTLINFLARLTNTKNILNKIINLLQVYKSFNLKKFSNFDVYILATQVNIECFTNFLSAIYLYKKEQEINILRQKAKKLHVYKQEAKALILGRDIIKLGSSPSKEFSKILHDSYLAQLRDEFSNYTEAIIWLKKYLLNYKS